MTLSIDVVHQYPAARPEGAFFTIARGDLEVAFQADEELPLRRRDVLTGPTTREPDEFL